MVAAVAAGEVLERLVRGAAVRRPDKVVETGKRCGRAEGLGRVFL